jgi:hypothetical protein
VYTSLTLALLLSSGFEAPQSEVEFLRRRLAEERESAEKANLARREAETRCHLAEKERDVYRILARRWKSMLNSTLGRSEENNLGEMEDIEEAAAAMLLGGRDPISILGLGSIYRRFRAQAVALRVEEDEDEEDDEDDEDIFELNEQADIMEEDEDNMNEDMVDEDDDDENLSLESNHRVAHAAIGSNQLITATHSSDGAKAIAARPQVRMVSISGPDI